MREDEMAVFLEQLKKLPPEVQQRIVYIVQGAALISSSASTPNSA